jgi:hypothetical protein
MKAGPVITISGIIMIIFGLVLFYSIQSDQNLDQSLRLVKHGGTFVGLMGRGIMTAGILLYLIEREQPPIQEDFDM